MDFARGGIVDRQDTGSDDVPVVLAGCGYLVPATVVRDLIAQLPPVPPAHP